MARSRKVLTKEEVSTRLRSEAKERASKGPLAVSGSSRKHFAAPPQFEVNRSGATGYSNNCMAVLPPGGYFASNFAGAAACVTDALGRAAAYALVWPSQV